MIFQLVEAAKEAVAALPTASSQVSDSGDAASMPDSVEEVVTAAMLGDQDPDDFDHAPLIAAVGGHSFTHPSDGLTKASTLCSSGLGRSRGG